MLKPIYLFVALISTMIVAPHSIAAKSSNYHSHEEIRQLAENFARSQIQVRDDEKLTIKTGSIDSRLRLRQCNQSISTFLPTQLPTQNISLVGVKCTSPVNWQLYVPISVSIKAPVVVANRSIHRNQLIRKEDLKIQERESTRLHGEYYQTKELIIGKVAKRLIKKNSIVLSGFLDEKQLVKRGQEVIILASVAGLHVKAKGVALTNGVKGDVIRVKNRASERIIEAVVIAHGEVEVRL